MARSVALTQKSCKIDRTVRLAFPPFGLQARVSRLLRHEVTDGLARLARLTALKVLDLRGPPVTDEGADKLASALPAVRISTWSRTVEPTVEPTVDMAPFTDADKGPSCR